MDQFLHVHLSKEASLHLSGYTRKQTNGSLVIIFMYCGSMHKLGCFVLYVDSFCSMLEHCWASQ